MGYFRTFVSGIWGGVCIALGGVAFLSLESNMLGALFFTVGSVHHLYYGLEPIHRQGVLCVSTG